MKWETSMHELIGLFKQGILALTPIAERAHMPWKEPDAYDDWDHICRAVYRSFVIMSVENADGSQGLLPLLDYDRRVQSYRKHSYVGNASMGALEAFICFETQTAPFDTCRFAVLDSEQNVVSSRQVPAVSVSFVLIGRDRHGSPAQMLDKLVVLL
jgi:hypothetical protein